MVPMKWFKLLLLNDDDIARDEIRQSKPMQEARNQLLLPNAPTATEVVGFYLKKLWDHTYNILKAKLEIDNLPLRVAITIPAIWPPYAQKAMREAAKIAGITAKRDIGATTLDLVQEPEAAGLSILFERSNLPEIQVGTPSSPRENMEHTNSGPRKVNRSSCATLEVALLYGLPFHDPSD